MDSSGGVFAAIQGLNEIVQEQANRIDELEAQLEEALALLLVQ